MKRLALFLVLALTVAAFGGCSTEPTDDTPKSSTTTTASTTTTQGAQGSSAPSGGDEQTTDVIATSSTTATTTATAKPVATTKKTTTTTTKKPTTTTKANATTTTTLDYSDPETRASLLVSMAGGKENATKGCGKCGHAMNGHHYRRTFDSNCPACGTFVPALACHVCGE